MSQVAMQNTQEDTLDQENLSPENKVDITRSRMYYLLSVAFSFPDEKLQPVQEELWELAATLYPEMEWQQINIDESSEKIEVEYINMFDGHEQKKYCKPYEGLWQEADRAKRQWEVKKYYQFFGLGLNADINEMPDHIMYELEFMHYLCYRMVKASNKTTLENSNNSDKDQAINYLQAQKDFLERHLSIWTGDFCELLDEKTEQAFYHQLSRLTTKFISDDLSWVQIQFDLLSNPQ